MRAKITKVQILADRSLGIPIFYCHASDAGHDPEIELSLHDDCVRLAIRTLFKVKANPQTRDRVDIYMSIEEARALGDALAKIVGDVSPRLPRTSKSDPHGARRGPMELPKIVWQRYLRTVTAVAKTRSGVVMRKSDAYLNVDLETRHPTHVRMGEKEVHLGLVLEKSSSGHDPSACEDVEVDESELQRPRNRAAETNPVPKVEGLVAFDLHHEDAAGLGQILSETGDL